MLKKTLVVGLGLLLVSGLMFGRRGLSYVSTCVSDIRESVKESIPIEMEIRSARQEVQSLDKDIRMMTHQIAKEEHQVEKFEADVLRQEEDVDKSFANIMRLRKHLESGDSMFVTHGQSYSNREVEADLRRRFDNHKTMEATAKKVRQIMEARKKGLDAAREKYAETVSAKHQLEVEIANLEARLKMVQVAETASEINFDNSRLSRARSRVDEIRTRIEVKEKVVNVAPDSLGGIPLEEPEVSDDILNEVNAYFNADAENFAGVEK